LWQILFPVVPMASPPEFTFSSGLPSLDGILQGILPGDNVVWQVDDLDDYVPFVNAFTAWALSQEKPLVYFRFAQHPPLVAAGGAVKIYALDPRDGFEHFITEILTVVGREGRGVCYVFDSLSGLSVDWYSDRMLGNFFRLACPYLYSYDTVAYFGLFRDVHTPLSISAIHTTAQVVLDVYRREGRTCLLPLKVLGRYTPTMYMLHSRTGDTFNGCSRRYFS